MNRFFQSLLIVLVLAISLGSISYAGSIENFIVNLTSQVTGTLPVANGGTGNSTSNPNFSTLTAIGTQNNSITLNPVYVGTSTNLQINGPLYPVADTTGLTTNLTASAVAVGSSTPLLLSAPGTYYTSATVNTAFSGATFAAIQQATCYLYRTNNTPATISDTTSTVVLPIITTTTLTGPTLQLGPVAYTTANTTDSISVYCSLSATPSVGNVQVTATHITALRQ